MPSGRPSTPTTPTPGREAPLQLSAGSEGEAVTFSELAGSWTVGSGSFADFGVTAPDLGFVRVDDAGSVEFSLELARG